MEFKSFKQILLKIWWYKLSSLILPPLDPDPNKKLGVWIRMKTYTDPKHWCKYMNLDPDPGFWPHLDPDPG